MAIGLQVHPKKWRRVVLVRFERAATGDPDITRPQPDDRGYAAPERGPIFGIVQGDTVTVRLRREMVENAAPLFVTSSDTSVFTVASPATGNLLPSTEVMDIQITGAGGGAHPTPRTAELEVRFASNGSSPPSGPIIHQATIWVWHPLHTIPVRPHNVTIEVNSGPMPRAARASVANVDAIMRLVNAIWRPCGLEFVPHSGGSWAAATQNITVALGRAGHIDLGTWPGEADTVLSNGVATAGVINAFFIHRFVGGTLGLGISPATAASDGFTRTGIILADETEIGGGIAHTTAFAANDLAHEIGHFLGLSHSENVHSNSPASDQARVRDTWTRRCLMYWANWGDPDTAQRVVGYGTVRVGSQNNALRGAMITMKDLTQRTTDGECARALGNLNSF